MRPFNKIALNCSVLFGLFLAALTAPAAHAQTIPQLCDNRSDMLSALDGNFSEKPVSLGLSHDGRVVEVLKSPDDTWTIILTAPNGVSCLLIAGNYWRNVVVKAQDLKL
ncbi:MAG: hypothetical protein IH994_01115 [Proteobacteria bacterium]|nr:hypothetical protein [Pseudomonadota bacterium]